uniref:Uncharacterized protein n=1 Tax=Heterorhabditis bacteriophora TaxID=37862 RepID=A0A1I7WJU7_HETBA
MLFELLQISSLKEELFSYGYIKVVKMEKGIQEGIIEVLYYLKVNIRNVLYDQLGDASLVCGYIIYCN